MRKTLTNVILMLPVLFLLTSCLWWHDPLSAFKSAQTKVNTSQTNLVTATETLKTNETKLATNTAAIDDHKQGLVFGASTALHLDPTPTVYNKVATQFADTELGLYGLPSTNEVLALRQTVADLVSSNAAYVVEGEKQLAAITAENKALQATNIILTKQVNESQNKVTEAETKVISATTKLEKVGAENSKLAETWTKIKRWVYGVFWFLVAGIVIKIVSICLPPPYNQISYIVSLPLSVIVKVCHLIFPEIKGFVGLCEIGWKDAVSDLTNSIQAIKVANPTLHASISSVVAANTNDKSIPLINASKADNKIVS